jgi:hypothetical protein
MQSGKEGLIMQIRSEWFNQHSVVEKSILLSGLILFIALVFNGCGASRAVKMNQAEMKETYELQKPVLIRTSEDDKRPKWTHNTVFEKEGKVYFTGGFLNGADYAVTIRCANAEALKNLVQAISLYIRAEFSEYAQGSNMAYDQGIERFVEDGIATFAENVHVQGIKQVALYYEEMFSPALMQPSFNVFVKLEMSKTDYMKAKADILRHLRDRLKNEREIEAKEKAENLLQKLKDEIKTAI